MMTSRCKRNDDYPSLHPRKSDDVMLMKRRFDKTADIKTFLIKSCLYIWIYTYMDTAGYNYISSMVPSYPSRCLSRPRRAFKTYLHRVVLVGSGDCKMAIIVL